MLSVRGVFQDGVVRPLQPVEAADGQQVIITFLDEAVAAPALSEAPVLVDEGGILVVVAEPLEDLSDITRRERNKRLSDLIQRVGL